MRLRRDSAANRKASSENRKVFSEESEGFFRRALGSYTHKFPKRHAASLTYLLRSHLGLPRLRLSWNSGSATEGFSNCVINFKDAYRTVHLLVFSRLTRLLVLQKDIVKVLNKVTKWQNIFLVRLLQTG